MAEVKRTRLQVQDRRQRLGRSAVNAHHKASVRARSGVGQRTRQLHQRVSLHRWILSGIDIRRTAHGGAYELGMLERDHDVLADLDRVVADRSVAPLPA
jgi:hypothetical protein